MRLETTKRLLDGYSLLFLCDGAKHDDCPLLGLERPDLEDSTHHSLNSLGCFATLRHQLRPRQHRLPQPASEECGPDLALDLCC